MRYEITKNSVALGEIWFAFEGAMGAAVVGEATGRAAMEFLDDEQWG